MTWFYEGSPIRDLPEDTFGFVYLIDYTDGTKYIGKKQTVSTVTLPALKSGKQRPGSARVGKNRNGKRVYFDIVTKEANWRNYTGSSKATSGKTINTKHILEFAHSKRFLTYLEAKYLFSFEVLEDDEYCNDNILGKFFDNVKD